MKDKTEKATPYKLQKAKEKGQVSKSIELNTAAVLIGLLITSKALWPAVLQKIQLLMSHLFSFACHETFSFNELTQLQQFILFKLMNLWLPFACVSVLCLSLSTIAQTGFVWSTQALIPDYKRLNFIHGFKRIFSSKTLFETGKSSLKLCLCIILFFFSLPHEIDNLFNLLSSTTNEHPQLIMQIILKMALQLLLVLLALATIDRLYTRWKYQKDNRMTKQEIKDEYRQREGDPKIKVKIKQLQQQLRQKTASLNQIKTADVLITNPTHLAIALKYERSVMPAPKVVFKASGEFANQAKMLAQRHKIPIIQNKLFARSLFATVELNHWIGNEHFSQAAILFREIFRQRELAS